jgi:branched-chain amino acid transport system permease protein
MYWISVFTEAAIFAILALGLDVVWGWTGDFDLAFYGYLALGSYMTFVLAIGKPTPPVQYIIGWRLPLPLAILLAMAAVVCLAAVIGAVALRNLRDIYFAVTTLGAVSALYLIVENYTPLFDGYNGVYGLINPGQTALGLTYDGYRIFFFVAVLVILFLAYLLVQRLSRSPFGRMLRSVREDERAAAAYGRSVFWTKYRAYLFGSALAGLTGGLFAVFISAFNPSAWTPQELLIVYAAILVGGRGNPRGVILGVFVVYPGFIELTRFLPSPASRPEFGPAMRQVLIGLLIILMLRFRPEGIVKERPGVDQKLPVAGRLPGLGRLRRAGVPPEGVPPDGGTPDGGTLASADAPPPGGPPTAAAGGPAAAAGDDASHPASAVRRSAGPARASEGQPAEDGSPE